LRTPPADRHASHRASCPAPRAKAPICQNYIRIVPARTPDARALVRWPQKTNQQIMRDRVAMSPKRLAMGVIPLPAYPVRLGRTCSIAFCSTSGLQFPHDCSDPTSCSLFGTAKNRARRNGLARSSLQGTPEIVACARSILSTKRPIRSLHKRRRNHTARIKYSSAFSHSQGHRWK
jgi:hypothetical protein